MATAASQIPLLPPFDPVLLPLINAPVKEVVAKHGEHFRQGSSAEFPW
jgi:hypothetical protein